jgi:hypothetical protein
MDLDFDVSVMTVDDLSGFTPNKNKFIKAIMSGALIVNDKGEPVYTCQRASTNGDAPVVLTFHEPRGASFMAMDRKKKGEDMAKTYAIMADMCKTDIVTFSKMPNSDLKVCTAIMLLFLA